MNNIWTALISAFNNECEEVTKALSNDHSVDTKTNYRNKAII